MILPLALARAVLYQLPACRLFGHKTPDAWTARPPLHGELEFCPRCGTCLYCHLGEIVAKPKWRD